VSEASDAPLLAGADMLDWSARSSRTNSMQCRFLQKVVVQVVGVVNRASRVTRLRHQVVVLIEEAVVLVEEVVAQLQKVVDRSTE
jgi:hypothetical protein